MADSNIDITQGTGTSVDTRTESTSGHHRQVVVLGDPSLNNNVAAIVSQDVAPSDQTTPAVLTRVAGSVVINFASSPGTAGVFLSGTGGTLGVRFGDEPTVISSGKQGTTTRPLIVNSDGAIKIYDITTGTISAVTGITNSIQVHLLSTAGTLNIKLDPSYNVVNVGGTIGLQQTLSGSTSAVSTSGTTIKAPTASRVIKVYAFSLTTTAQVGLTAKWTNGSGASPTEKWRVALQAPAQGIAGANLAVTPPGYLFAMGSNETLSLVLDTASLVHYSVGYFLESA